MDAAYTKTNAKVESQVGSPPTTEWWVVVFTLPLMLLGALLTYYARDIVDRAGGAPGGLIIVVAGLSVGLPVSVQIVRKLPNYAWPVIVAFVVLGPYVGNWVRQQDRPRSSHVAALSASAAPAYLGTPPNTCSQRGGFSHLVITCRPVDGRDAANLQSFKTYAAADGKYEEWHGALIANSVPVSAGSWAHGKKLV
ncbi:MAG: hypothetical protein QOC55_118, partial [Thermoleophilaceae bacterium]|nr:hypothetical protein [Thermoleophilaceae bacterium]